MLNQERKCGESAKAAAFNRRTALVAATLSVLAAGVTTRSADARHSTDLPEVIVRFLAAWEALDPDGIAQTYADDGIREDITSPAIVEGRVEIRRSLVDFVGAFDNAKVEHPVAFAAAEGFAADTWVFTGAYTGSLPGLPPGNGEPVIIRGFTLIETSDGSISRTVDYYDAYGLLLQVGGEGPSLSGDPDGATPPV